jgi:hypothetical protein
VTSRNFQIIDQVTSDLCAVRPRARYDYRLKCAGFAARSVQKIRRLSKNSENVLAKANLGQVTIVGGIVLV